MTYIGNAPNFMVKNIAEQTEADVPSFVEYIYRYSIPVLLPVFGVIWFILFHW
jgi:Na+/H+ antiporter NhaD/arsenite permease-like protein